MNVTRLHKITSDSRSRKERAIELKEAFINFKETNEIQSAFIVIKNCLTLVNDVLEFSTPIQLETYYFNFAKSFMKSSLDCSGVFNYFRDFEQNFEQYIKLELFNDQAPRFYCKQWFSTVVGVLEKQHRLSLSEIENMYCEWLERPLLEQLSLAI